ncbi:MAG: hypothetical protein PWP71_2327, partial [Clostridia bacterium]|nr:hypothetical protein [Clostridia bacterium]
ARCQEDRGINATHGKSKLLGKRKICPQLLDTNT